MVGVCFWWWVADDLDRCNSELFAFMILYLLLRVLRVGFCFSCLCLCWIFCSVCLFLLLLLSGCFWWVCDLVLIVCLLVSL